jgi:hypothetical protein
MHNFGTRVSLKMPQISHIFPAKRVKKRVKRVLHVTCKEYKNIIFYYIKCQFTAAICVYLTHHWHTIINDI